MKYRPTNTLAHFNAAPQTHLHDLSALPSSVLAASANKYRQQCKDNHLQASPQDDAFTFYALNHAASVVRKLFTPNESLPEWALWVMQQYSKATMEQGERMLHYIFCITTREMRHLKSCTAPFWNKVEKEFDAKSVHILKHISSEGGEEQAMHKFLVAPPDMTIGQYTKTLSYGFHHAGSSGWNGGYGGPKWGNIADAATSVIHGTTSLEMLVNTGYELAHNGGPMFNKTEVKIYQHQDENALLTILDVQRSGQMLDLALLEGPALFGLKKTSLAVEAAKLVRQHEPKELKGYVDWKSVDELRPEFDKQKHPNKYHKHTGAQVKPKVKHAVPPAPPVVPAPPKPVTLHGKKATAVGTYQVYPGQTVTVVKREGA